MSCSMLVIPGEKKPEDVREIHNGYTYDIFIALKESAGTRGAWLEFDKALAFKIKIFLT